VGREHFPFRSVDRLGGAHGPVRAKPSGRVTEPFLADGGGSTTGPSQNCAYFNLTGLGELNKPLPFDFVLKLKNVYAKSIHLDIVYKVVIEMAIGALNALFEVLKAGPLALGPWRGQTWVIKGPSKVHFKLHLAA
jgi:hypothetical protein